MIHSLSDFSDFLLFGPVPILVKETKSSVYDFRFRDYFEFKSITDSIDTPVLLRIGAIAVDIAKTQNDNWIVIEVNDGQESGYAGVNRIALWENIMRIERG